MNQWDTILTLKEDHEVIGVKGEEFFISDFPYNIETEELDYVIAQPTFAGVGVGKGIESWVLDSKQIVKLFNVSEKTFEDVAKKLEEKFWEERD